MGWGVRGLGLRLRRDLGFGFIGFKYINYCRASVLLLLGFRGPDFLLDIFLVDQQLPLLLLASSQLTHKLLVLTNDCLMLVVDQIQLVL